MSRLILLIALLSVSPAQAQLCWPCDTTIWVLTYNGYTIDGLGDMDEGQCQEMLEELDPQTRPFTPLKCEEIDADREEF